MAFPKRQDAVEYSDSWREVLKGVGDSGEVLWDFVFKGMSRFFCSKGLRFS